MLSPRLIPCLLIQNNGLVKTRKFKDPKYVGDPINAVRIFNDKLVDELIVLDIGATASDCEPNYKLISKVANECRSPLCYGGGVKNIDQIERIIGLGVEKVALSSVVVERPGLIEEAASRVGSQSVVFAMDIARRGLSRSLSVLTHNATRRTRLDPIDLIRSVTALGAGEVVVNNVDRDGTMTGFDYEMISTLRRESTLPMTFLGGAGSLNHIAELWKKFGLVGASAGSLFVFKGKYRAVLISYPNPVERAALYAREECGQ